MPGQGGMVTMTNVNGSVPGLRNWKCVPSGIEWAVCGFQRDDGLMLALAAPELARAGQHIPELVDGAMGDGQGYGARRQGAVDHAAARHLRQEADLEPSGASTSWLSAGRPVAKDAVMGGAPWSGPEEVPEGEQAADAR